jgi:hypothetical protein
LDPVDELFQDYKSFSSQFAELRKGGITDDPALLNALVVLDEAISNLIARLGELAVARSGRPITQMTKSHLRLVK